MATAAAGVDDSSQPTMARATWYRAKPAVIRQRALELGLTRVSARALAAYAGVNRKTMERVLSGLPVSEQTATKIMYYFARDGEPEGNLFEPVAPLPQGGLGRLADRPSEDD